MAAHARLSPSGAATWMACPGSISMARGLPDTSSDSSERGTAAHELLELLLTGKPVPASLKMSNGVTLSLDDVVAVESALDWLSDETDEDAGDEIETETRLVYNDDLWGTCDFSRYRPSTKELLVADYKHGVGVVVEARNNWQGAIYAIMKCRQLGNRGIASVRFVIIQPRAFHSDGPVREWTIDACDLLELEGEILAGIERVREAESTEGPDWADRFLARGTHCRWCKANVASICPLVQREIEAAAAADFAPGYSPQKLAEALAICDRAEAAIKATRAFAYAEADRGAHIPGWKLVAKRPTDRWRDEQAVKDLADMLGLPPEEIHEEPKLRSPAQMRGKLADLMDGKTKKAREDAARQLLAEHIESVSSGTTLVPDDDKRAAKGDATQDFTPITD
ncbi:DUF2800 domain-containing protein [Pannonibacter tanglangensis]|uniref:DUF2800 domain-containing protein n=1 Tax=Pannonibacter tanglangensis TaxID=2750084 RepID=A0ABW9ZH98_9HYPH|nr:DUF2800 domain-containing protein [Pannonibacter sp. XCT-34]NBN62085.1 DUF2800 domain-containing protein [Pannonibacter sp. XCT-34]